MQITIKEVLLAGAGGFAGSACRFVVSMALAPAAGTGFPAGTFTVNLAGSFLIGVFMALSVDAPLLLLLTTGFCGGFTTFSAFSAETLAMVRGGHPLAGAGYAAASVLGCVAMVYAGLTLAGRVR